MECSEGSESPVALMREESRNAGSASATPTSQPWSAMSRALCEVGVAEALCWAGCVWIVKLVVGVTHSVDAVGVTSGPVASPASDSLCAAYRGPNKSAGR